MNGGNGKKFWHKVMAYAMGFRDADHLAIASQRHDDSIAIWIIGLASGTVIAVPAVLNYIVDIKSLSRWALAFALGPFVLAVVIGIRYRRMLADMMQKAMLFSFKKNHVLEVFQLKRFGLAQGLDDLEKEFKDIQDNKVVGLDRLYTDIQESQRRVKRLRRWLYILFGVGVVIMAVITIGAP